MQRLRHLLDARVLESLLEHAQAFIERHSGVQKVTELLRENQQLAMRHFEIARRRGNCGRSLPVDGLGRRRGRDRYDANGNAVLLLNLSNGNGTIGNIQYAFDETALSIARAIGKLRHWVVKSALKFNLSLRCRPIHRLFSPRQCRIRSKKLNSAAAV